MMKINVRFKLRILLKVIFLYTMSALLSGASVLLMVGEASLNQQFSTEKYYSTVTKLAMKYNELE